eukprot:Sspe_Gene.15147::Locus_5258_Transcript_1_1_Confidence_1.000_Length_1315::g.15147::m.15147
MPPTGYCATPREGIVVGRWEMKSHYEVLGVSPKAAKGDIRKAYHRLAREYHPDRNPDLAEAEVLFKKVQEAHETLIDDKLRAEYDLELAASDGTPVSDIDDEGPRRHYRRSPKHARHHSPQHKHSPHPHHHPSPHHRSPHHPPHYHTPAEDSHDE